MCSILRFWMLVSSLFAFHFLYYSNTFLATKIVAMRAHREIPHDLLVNRPLRWRPEGQIDRSYLILLFVVACDFVMCVTFGRCRIQEALDFGCTLSFEHVWSCWMFLICVCKSTVLADGCVKFVGFWCFMLIYLDLCWFVHESSMVLANSCVKFDGFWCFALIYIASC